MLVRPETSRSSDLLFTQGLTQRTATLPSQIFQPARSQTRRCKCVSSVAVQMRWEIPGTALVVRPVKKIAAFRTTIDLAQPASLRLRRDVVLEADALF